MEIETSKKFRIRHEDYYFFVALILLSLPIHAILISAGQAALGSTTAVIIGLIVLDFLLLGTVLFNSWYHFRQHLSEKTFIENGRIIKTQNGHVIFDYALSSIVSIRIQNKKGNEGTVILFTDKRSVNYAIMYGMPGNKTPLDCHGFTDYKVSFVKDRKALVTEIYKANPNLHFIETY